MSASGAGWSGEPFASCCQPDVLLFLPLIELSRTFHTLPSLSFPQGCLSPIGWSPGEGLGRCPTRGFLLTELIIIRRAQQTNREGQYQREKKVVRHEAKGGRRAWDPNKLRFEVQCLIFYLDLKCSYPTSALRPCCSGRLFTVVNGFCLVAWWNRVLGPCCT
jgi:hypothetical protein